MASLNDSIYFLKEVFSGTVFVFFSYSFDIATATFVVTSDGFFVGVYFFYWYYKIIFLNIILGMRVVLSRTTPVRGFVLFPLENHSSTAFLSNVWPSVVMTGSYIMHWRIGQKKSSG